MHGAIVRATKPARPRPALPAARTRPRRRAARPTAKADCCGATPTTGTCGCQPQTDRPRPAPPLPRPPPAHQRATTMTTIEVFEPALCCNTGVCGDDVDQALVTFSADLDWATANGGRVVRHNLANDPLAFAEQRRPSSSSSSCPVRPVCRWCSSTASPRSPAPTPTAPSSPAGPASARATPSAERHRAALRRRGRRPVARLARRRLLQHRLLRCLGLLLMTDPTTHPSS